MLALLVTVQKEQGAVAILLKTQAAKVTMQLTQVAQVTPPGITQQVLDTVLNEQVQAERLVPVPCSLVF